MFKMLSEKEMIKEERKRALAQISKQNEADELMLEQMVDIDFRLSVSELEAK